MMIRFAVIRRPISSITEAYGDNYVLTSVFAYRVSAPDYKASVRGFESRKGQISD